MPNIKSAKKRVLVTDKKRTQNRMILSEMKTAIKKFNLAISENNVEEAERLLPIASHAIDSAATKGIRLTTQSPRSVRLSTFSRRAS